MSETTEYQLADIFPVSMSGEWGSDPFDKGNALVLRAADFTKDCKLRATIGAPRNIPQFKLGNRVLKDGDILIEKSGGSPDQPVGRVAFFDRGKEKEIYIHSNFLQLLRVAEGFDKKFSYYLMAFLYSSGLVLRYQQQTTGIINLKLENYLTEKVFIPSESVQRRIQEILSTIDRTITHTEALIEKYQQIKAGLMHDLFTRGIGADGQLRPMREQAPELYWESPIGWIPKEWEVKRCSDLCSRICVGIVIQPTQYYVNDGVPAFRSANIREDGIDPNNFVYISPYSNNLLAKSQVKEGDILSVRTGYPGTSVVVPKEFIGANCIDILISTPGNQTNSEYLCHWINSSFGKEQVLRQQGGMAQQHFNVGEMRQLLVALPNIPEQLLIANKLKICANRLDAEQATFIKLQKQKSGLMHDLLTGKVPVNINTAEVAHG
jgi:type I restriction enzyme, S subunit